VSVNDFHDHHAVVYVATETRDELQDVVRSWDPLPAPSGLNCHLDRNWSGNQEMPGPGEQQGSFQKWVLHKGFTVRERDVLSIESGPRAPILLKVHSVTACTMPIVVNHYEVTVEVWYGSLVEPVTGS
jgi:hypothetical protein